MPLHQFGFGQPILPRDRSVNIRSTFRQPSPQPFVYHRSHLVFRHVFRLLAHRRHIGRQIVQTFVSQSKIVHREPVHSIGRTGIVLIRQVLYAESQRPVLAHIGRDRETLRHIVFRGHGHRLSAGIKPNILHVIL